ncbi:DUF1320 domain-containing protein [Gluconacetobacter entanii]|uniref:DUF1320 domain-containing protein n=1 Tax=Gluconacetobacter entanii TaxID=108528 RepID=UPI001C933B65|nr:DUF1320 domain-containing protein [Gluconacetobacter entanii]MBY4640290.1 DUF1320 domain-containing protein [Gluconacetobacter entanii]MCW4579936.1 DUF1320 domain-containing protein [Gluconacetobacter entanii]MCW4584649.1 DUF1320 domain-containing protein [Gluconacetobacter entanii]MCW4588089.1 DUF1320 domain-containing protein [Gluconacetobacter entanii]
MAYAALADMMAKYGTAELVDATADLDTPLDTIDQGKIQAALDQASSRMDSYLRRRYVVPVANPPPVLVQYCCAVARYLLHSGGNSNPSEQMRTDYRDAIAWLKDINNEHATLDGAIPANTTEEFARIQTRPAGFHPGRMY